MKTAMPASDPFVGKMERALDVMSRRQGVIATNLANIDTPRFKTLDVDFKAALKRAVHEAPAAEETGTLAAGRTAPIDITDLTAPERGLAVRNDGNNVALDQEMLKLSETSSHYEKTAAMLRMKIRQLIYAVSDGRSG